MNKPTIDTTSARPGGLDDVSSAELSKPLTLTFRRFAALILTLIALISIFGYYSYRSQKAAADKAAYERIEAIGNLKAAQITDWLRERRGDALTLFNSGLGAGLQTFLVDPTSAVVEQRQRRLTWLHSLMESYNYSTVALLDAGGKIVLSAPAANLVIEPETHAFIEQTLHARQVVFSDLYRIDTMQSTDAIHLDFAIPLLVDRNLDGTLVGILLLRINPYDRLYPLLQQWPVPSRTAETLLVRRNGQELVFLSPLRHRPDAPLSLRLPLSTPDLPAARALRGEAGETSGRDYRGVPVLAALRAIPDSPWYVVAKLDQQEIHEHFQQHLLDTLLIMSLLITAAGFLAWGCWRRYNEVLVQRTNRFLATRIEAQTSELRESEARLRLWKHVVETTKNGVAIADATREDYPVVAVNPAFERITGYGADEVLGRNLRFLHGQDREQPGLKAVRTALRKQRSCEVVLRNYRKDGTLYWNKLYIAPVRNNAGQATHFVGMQDDITERKTYETRLEFQANYDSLTKLPNRNLLKDRLQHAVTHARRTNQSLAVLFVDLDRFKLVNDSLSHAMGDTLLQMVAERLKTCVRESDTVARLGGDEFIILLENLSQPELAKLIADKVLDMTKIPYALDGYDFFINASVGISLFPRDGADGQTLLKNADIALHRAKEQGRHRTEFYSPELNELVLRRVMLENGLRQALVQGELELHYQPQVALGNDRITGVEALLRWRHPTLGMISPTEFIPLAEESGLIISMGEWVLRTACSQVKTWQEAGLPIFTVGVNLSGRQFLEAGLAETVASVLEETGLDPHDLELEITESLLMHDVESTITTLQSLKRMGVRLTIDDFGTGYSSLAYLKRFPLDRLKIDQSFVRDVTTDPNDTAITLAVIALAHSLGLQVIAEGVETENQLAFLRDNHCDTAQGYFFNRPLPADELVAFLHQSAESSLTV